MCFGEEMKTDLNDDSHMGKTAILKGALWACRNIHCVGKTSMMESVEITLWHGAKNQRHTKSQRAESDLYSDVFMAWIGIRTFGSLLTSRVYWLQIKEMWD